MKSLSDNLKKLEVTLID